MRAKIRHLRYLRHMWALPGSKSFYRFILTNFVERFAFVFFYFQTETDVPNCVQMLHLRTQVCFAASLHNNARITHVCTIFILSLFFAFVTGAKELIAKLIEANG